MAKVLDNVFISLFSAALCFCWMYYCTKDTALAGITAAAVAVTMSAAIQLLFRKDNKKKRTAAEKKRTAAFAVHTSFNDIGENIEKALKASGKEISACGGGFKDEADGGTYFAPRFSPENFKLGDLSEAVKTAKKENCANLEIMCNSCDKSAADASVNAGVNCTFKDAYATLKFLEENDAAPNFSAAKQTKHRPVLSYVLGRKRFGAYFGASVFLTLTSFISFFRYYNLAWATALFLLSLYCLFNKRFNLAV